MSETKAAAPARPPADREIELKLAVDETDLPRLRRSDLLKALRPRISHQTDVYYDTSGLEFAARSLTLRVRSIGKRSTQTLKRGGAGGSAVQVRREWNTRLPAGPYPNLQAFTAEEAREAVDGIDPAALQPLFTTRIRREKRILSLLDPSGTLGRVEMVIDTGFICHDQSRVPVSEVELELLEGPPAVLCSAALMLNEAIPLRIAPLSKAHRGYALAAGWRAKPIDTDSTNLQQDMSIDQAAAAVFRDCLTRWSANEAAVLDGSDPEGVHKMRVGLRRLRSALALFDKTLDDPVLQHLKEDAKWAFQGLGDARDWDVFLNEILAPLEAERKDGDLVTLKRVVQARLERAYAAAREMILSPRYCSFVLRTGQWVELQPTAPAEGDKTLTAFADAVLAKRYKKVRKRGKGFVHLSADERHQLRIAVKKLRYAVDFFGGLFENGDTDDYSDNLGELQDDLGRQNDLAVMERRLTALTADGMGNEETLELCRASGKVIGWHAREVALHAPHLTKRWKRFKKGRRFW